MRALDLFCAAGGATRGLQLAGFHVTGVDLVPSPRYPGDAFIEADALTVPLGGYDFIWASPPCQRFTAYRRRGAGVGDSYPDLIAPVRERLAASGVPYVIENVQGAPVLSSILLCGSMFGMDVRRHRYFECSFPILHPACNHAQQTPRFAQATNRKNLRSTVEVGVWRIPLCTQQAAMGIDWMTLEELSEAIPPAYSEFIGRRVPLVQRASA
jgi:DNA (cytosine-5)-methyltransferase 1